MLKQISQLLQAGAPSDDQRHWDAALRILQKINPDLVLTKLGWWQRTLARLRFWLPNQNIVDAWLDEQKPTPSEISSGVATRLKAKRPESRAFEIQVRVLEYAIQLRKAVYRQRLALSELPENQEKELERVRKARLAGQDGNTQTTIRDYMARIDEEIIPPEAREDIVADYWNKLASVCWEAATLAEEHQADPSPWLRRARSYIDIVQHDRPGWTPAQLNEARIRIMEGRNSEALAVLEQILGKKKMADLASPPAPPDYSAAIADMILKMANVERDAKSIADIVDRSYRPISQTTIRNVMEVLAGKVSTTFLNEIWRDVTKKKLL